MNDIKKIASNMDLTDRTGIEVGLCRKENFKTIAAKLGRHPSSVSHEIKSNRSFIAGNYPYGNDCRLVSGCMERHLCGDGACPMFCCSCSKGCNQFCDQYQSISCKAYEQAPYVCNACSKRKSCTYDRYFYSARYADALAKRRHSDAHSGIRMDEESFRKMDKVIQTGIRKGQPLEHICQSNPSDVPVTSRRIYTYIDEGRMSVKNIDLRRKAGYKRRRKKAKDRQAREQKCRIGRTYADFTAFMEGKSDGIVTEMDTVKGKREKGAVMLTMLLRRNSVMLIFWMPDNTQESVKRCIDFLETGLGLEVFKRLFGLILTDNGSEFKGVDDLELNAEGLTRTSIYYCDPMQSGQKGRLEKNHEYIRYVIPKGTSLDGYSQSDLTLLVNHINSTSRPGLDGQCPYDTIPGDDNDMRLLMNLMKFEVIPPQKVNLTASLFRSSRSRKELP